MKELPQREKALYIGLLKWLPAAGTTLIVIHYLHLIFFGGERTILVDYIADVSLFAWAFLYMSSRIFFCRIHQALCIYIGIACLDIDLHRWLNWSSEPAWAIPALMATAGMALLALAFFKKIHVDQ